MPIEEAAGGVIWHEGGWDKRELAAIIAREYAALGEDVKGMERRRPVRLESPRQPLYVEGWYW